MTNEQYVKRLHPDAICFNEAFGSAIPGVHRHIGKVIIAPGDFIHPAGPVIGRGSDEHAAWADAARRMGR